MEEKQRKWTIKSRNYVKEKREVLLQSRIAYEHPLQGAISKVLLDGSQRSNTPSTRSSRSSSVSQEQQLQGRGHFNLDPLGIVLEGRDPLSVLVAEAVDPLSSVAISTDTSSAQSDSSSAPVFEPWAGRKVAILTKYTTSEKLTITTSFLSSSERDKVLRSQSSTASDIVKNRLEQLDDFEEGSVKETLNLSQQDYVKRIDELHNALISAWDQDQRVKSLKIAIQCSKLLADVSVIQFYPSKFVLVTEILDTFGKLVYDRIINKATYIPKGSKKAVQLLDNFKPEDVPDSAQETCRNWFFKIASIRELVPRFYVETALLKCYSFLADGEYNAALRRLSLMTRGIGDPLVAMYARCYLSRVGILVAPSIRDHLYPCFEDFIMSYKQMAVPVVQNTLAVQRLDMGQYLQLYSPALDWTINCLVHRAPAKILLQVLEKVRNQCNNALLLNSIMTSHKADYIAERAVEFSEYIKLSDETAFPKHLLYKSLGNCVVISAPPEDVRLSLLNDVWKNVTKLVEPTDYINCAEVWIEFVVQHFTAREINVFLTDIIKHMTPDRAFENHYVQLQAVITKILAHQHNFSQLFAMDKFLAFLDLFQRDTVKAQVCQIIADSYIRWQTETTYDPVVISTMMAICTTLHDSISALSVDDQVRCVSQSINSFIHSVSFRSDVEQQLNFYVDARAAFSKLDSVMATLVQAVNSLIMFTHRLVNGVHNRKTAAFVRAGIAYSYITIPSLRGILVRLRLYLLSGQVALTNNCLTQGDAFFMAAMLLLPELPRSILIEGKSYSTEPWLLDYVSQFLATSIVIPDNPDQEVLYLLRGLLSVLNKYQWDSSRDTYALALTQVLCLLSTLAQDVYPYHIKDVESNDTLYGNDPTFVSEINDLAEVVVTQILDHVRQLDTQQARQSSLARELFERVIAHSELSSSSALKLAYNMWSIGTNGMDQNTKARILQNIQLNPNKSIQHLLTILRSKP